MSEEIETPEGDEDAAADAWAAALEEQADSEDGDAETLPAAEFDNLDDTAAPLSSEANLDVILDIPVTISMEIGRSRIPRIMSRFSDVPPPAPASASRS